MIAAVRKEIANETDRETGRSKQISTVPIYLSLYSPNVCFEKDVTKQEAMWERQHEFAVGKIYTMCSDLGGFFLKVYNHHFGGDDG
ncbi:hypothetical protein LOK49_LG10G00540 [Camellia lanceoleosa]|uniref:Uncharacterized protein n=1 Tax=Camellia lanceoleosa TaxID=1840588 RepID=A0ACC0GCC1_9ERIC|nr:hypothetical protein LOK49_LG10G00540 [Camellia lanceoleosa]